MKSMFTIKKHRALLLIFSMCLLCMSILLMPAKNGMTAGPNHLSLQSFTVLKEHDQLIVRTAVDIEPRDAMRHLLRDGAQTLLTCTASLTRERSLLPNSTVATSTAAMVLNYDPLSRQYILATALPEDAEEKEDGAQDENAPPKVPAIAESYGHRDFNTLMDRTLSRLRMPLCAASLLEEDEDYFVTMRVELRHTKVPPWLSQTLFFWSWDVVPSIEFSQALHGE